MSEEYIKRVINARRNRLEYSFLSNEQYAAKLQQLSDVQDRMYRRARILIPQE